MLPHDPPRAKPADVRLVWLRTHQQLSYTSAVIMSSLCSPVLPSSSPYLQETWKRIETRGGCLAAVLLPKEL